MARKYNTQNRRKKTKTSPPAKRTPTSEPFSVSSPATIPPLSDLKKPPCIYTLFKETRMKRLQKMLGGKRILFPRRPVYINHPDTKMCAAGHDCDFCQNQKAGNGLKAPLCSSLGCTTPTCTGCLVSCDECHSLFCKDDVRECYYCGLHFCLQHISFCSVSSESCMDTLGECVCRKCTDQCSICEKPVCLHCSQKCSTFKCIMRLCKLVHDQNNCPQCHRNVSE
jgi:hypothetical protein